MLFVGTRSETASNRPSTLTTDRTNKPFRDTVVNLERKARAMLLKTDDVACNAQHINKKAALSRKRIKIN
jgi:hypothetical protein